MKLPTGRPLILGVVAAALALSALGYVFIWGPLHRPANELRLQGHMEATETDLAFKVPGKITAIHMDEGDWIKQGQVVAELEAQDLKDEVARAAGWLAASQANLDKMAAGYRPQEVREAQAQAARAKADLVDKKLDYERYENLFQRRVVAGSTRDRYEANYLMARATHQAAVERLDLLKEGFRQEDIDRARGEFEQAKAALELAQTRLGYATIYGPVNGVALVRPGQPGQVAAIGTTVITMADMDNIYFQGYIPETELARVKFGQKAYITTDTYPNKKFPAWVSFINNKAEFTPKTVETYKERVTLVYRTKIRAENPNYELKPGMPAEAVILLDSQPK